jgi:hypothetical protein
MGKKIRKETDLAGREREVIYEDGKRRGEIRQETTLSGQSVKREDDSYGKHVADTYYETTLTGQDVQTTYDARSGRQIGQSHRETTLSGETTYGQYDPGGNRVG